MDDGEAAGVLPEEEGPAELAEGGVEVGRAGVGAGRRAGGGAAWAGFRQCFPLHVESPSRRSSSEARGPRVTQYGGPGRCPEQRGLLRKDAVPAAGTGNT